jgi:putative endonuclease
MDERQYYVYIMSSRSTTLYVGMTNDLLTRVWQHKEKLVDGFTKRYSIDRLVYYEAGGSLEGAANREHELKGWNRAKKITLVESKNPAWRDLYLELTEQNNAKQKPVIKHESGIITRRRDSSLLSEIDQYKGGYHSSLNCVRKHIRKER